VNVRLIDAGALAAVPFANGRGEVMVSGRYGYPGPILHAVTAIAAPQAKVDLEYWDYQVRARYRTSSRDEFSVFALGSFDRLASGTSYYVQFHRVDLRWDHRTGGTGRLRLAFTAGVDQVGETQTTQVVASTSEPGSAQILGTVTNVTQIRNGIFGLRMDWMDAIAPTADLRLGADAVLEPYDVAVPGLTPVGGLSGVVSTSGAPGSIFSHGFRQTDLNAAAYAELTWRPERHIELLPGLRTDVFTSRYPSQTSAQRVDAQARPTIDPRLTARWHVFPSIALVLAAGAAHQPSNFPLPFVGVNFSQLSRGLQTAYQYSAGTELTLPLGFSANANAFASDYTGLADYYDVCPNGEATCTFKGRAIGLEVLVRRKLTERLTGWLSYTLSRVERDALYSAGGAMPPVWIRRLSEFDRTHVVNVVFAADLGKRWRAGARVVAYSGLPYNASTSFDAPPDARGPPFVRLDVRLEKSWDALGGKMTFVFEWLNALLQKESLGTTCTTDATTLQERCSPAPLAIPITLPSVGLEWAWAAGGVAKN
jgi:hypothetical protein